jgi:hypothetical protein
MMTFRVTISDSRGRTEVMNSGSLHRTGTQEALTLPSASARPLPPELGSPTMLTVGAAVVPMPKRDPLCALCSQPIENGVRAVQIAGVRLHVPCAARRRSSLRR